MKQDNARCEAVALPRGIDLPKPIRRAPFRRSVPENNRRRLPEWTLKYELQSGRPAATAEDLLQGCGALQERGIASSILHVHTF